MNTGNKPGAPRCTLVRFIPSQIDAEEIKRDGWTEHQILVVRSDDRRLTWIERQIVHGIGKKLYQDRRSERG